MRTETINILTFDELSEKGKRKAIDGILSIGMCSEFIWDDTKEDAKQINLKLISLDDRRANEGEFIISAYDTSCRIVQEHGKSCQTHKTAVEFGKDWNALVEKYSDGIDLYKVTEENEYYFDKEADELETEFLKSLLEDYWILYKKNVEYSESDEAIIETINANNYEFTEDGELI